jgi:hypothetical protein
MEQPACKNSMFILTRAVLLEIIKLSTKLKH